MYNNPKYKYQFYASDGETQAPAFDPQLPPVIKEETSNNTQKPKKKNLITVLKKLLAAFGGEETQSNNAVEIVDKIADSVEQGGGGALVVHDNDGTLDKTMNEIQTAAFAGTPIVVITGYESAYNIYYPSNITPVQGVSVGQFSGSIALPISPEQYNYYAANGRNEAEALAAYPTFVGE